MTVTNRTALFTVTSFPLKSKLVTPSDTADLPEGPAIIRPDAAGAVTVIPAGNTDTEVVTYNLTAGEPVPCLVRRVKATGTDAITLHAHYD